MHKVTISDVAHEAGVSLQTVSRAINNKAEISPATRERILKISSEMGFRPSSLARNLATQQTTTIGIIVPDIANPFFSEIVRGAGDLADTKSYHVLLCNTDEDTRHEMSALESLLEKQVDGVILCSLRLEETDFLKTLDQFSAAVLINRDLSSPMQRVRTIAIDDRRGGFTAVNHLLAAGHRKIGFLVGPERSESGANRLKGYCDGLIEYSVRIDQDLVLYCEPSIAGGIHAANKLFESQQDVTGVLCFNDLTAIGAMKACSESGLDVPDDIAIIGFDDILFASFITPALTTMRIPTREIGTSAMRLLIDLMEDRVTTDSRIEFQMELVVRESAP